MFMDQGAFTDGPPGGGGARGGGGMPGGGGMGRTSMHDGDVLGGDVLGGGGADPTPQGSFSRNAPGNFDVERMEYTGGSGRPQQRPGTASMPVMPMARPGSSMGRPPTGSGSESFTNALFGAEQDETGAFVVEAMPSNPQTAAKQRMEQQKALAAAKRKERSMMSGAVIKNDRPPSARPGSARPGSARPSMNGRAPPAMPPASGSAFQRNAYGAAGGSSFHMGEMQQANEETEGALEVKELMQKQGLRTEYDPALSPQDPKKKPGGAGGRVPRPVATVDTSDMRVFLLQPGPKTGPVLCHIRRTKASGGMYPKYVLYLGGGMDNSGNDVQERFLLSARKRKKSKSSNYLISLDEEDMSRQSGNFFGKLRSNFVGTEFTIYDKGIKPSEAEGQNLAPHSLRSELGAVVYQYNVLGTRGPRKMTALLPRVDEEGNRAVFRPTKDEKEGILTGFKSGTPMNDLVVMQNKPPKWNEQMQAHCLNFHGRVTHASVKNFQLVTEENKEHIILQFGKVGKDTFTMDYQWPISALQAFAICLTSFDNKLVCE